MLIPNNLEVFVQRNQNNFLCIPKGSKYGAVRIQLLGASFEEGILKQTSEVSEFYVDDDLIRRTINLPIQILFDTVEVLNKTAKGNTKPMPLDVFLYFAYKSKDNRTIYITDDTCVLSIDNTGRASRLFSNNVSQEIDVTNLRTNASVWKPMLNKHDLAENWEDFFNTPKEGNTTPTTKKGYDFVDLNSFQAFMLGFGLMSLVMILMFAVLK
jgi:hypothetical protein